MSWISVGFTHDSAMKRLESEIKIQDHKKPKRKKELSVRQDST